MITKDKITMYICSYALDATKYPYKCKYATSNEQLLDTFPYDFSLNKIIDMSSFSRQVVTLHTSFPNPQTP